MSELNPILIRVLFNNLVNKTGWLIIHDQHKIKKEGLSELSGFSIMSGSDHLFGDLEQGI